MSLSMPLEDFTVVFTENQTSGKGQMGSKWVTEQGKNLTFSVFLDTSFLKLEHQFYLNCIVSITVFNVLKKMLIPSLSIKWPNDILSANFKISGILIENVVKSNADKHSVIGIGLNVNQTEFSSAFKATSLKKITGKHYVLEELMFNLVSELKEQVNRLRKNEFKQIHDEYEGELFRKNKPSTFKNAEGQLFSGFIKSVTPNGKLQVLLEDEILEEFNLKEVNLLY